jgi:hypothetical protein
MQPPDCGFLMICIDSKSVCSLSLGWPPYTVHTWRLSANWPQICLRYKMGNRTNFLAQPQFGGHYKIICLYIHLFSRTAYPLDVSFLLCFTYRRVWAVIYHLQSNLLTPGLFAPGFICDFHYGMAAVIRGVSWRIDLDFVWSRAEWFDGWRAVSCATYWNHFGPPELSVSVN